MRFLIFIIFGLMLVFSGCITEKLDTIDLTSVQYTPNQCAGNPWQGVIQENWLEAGSEEEALAIIDYYKKEHQIILSNIVFADKREVVCEACTCPREHDIIAFVSSADFEKLKKLGWMKAH